MTISFFDKAENTVGKGENAGYRMMSLKALRWPKNRPVAVQL